MSEPKQDDWFDLMKAITYAHVERISNFSAASSEERSPLFQPIEGSFAENSCDSSVSNPRKVPDAVNESGRVALNLSKVADQGKASSVRIVSLCVGNGGGESVSSPLYLLSSEIVSLVEADRLLKSLSVTEDYARPK